MSSSISKPLLLSKLLDLHLSRVIAREHLKDRVMRKFVQLAEDVEADLKGLDKDADELQARRLLVKERATQAVNMQHKIQDTIEGGIAAMERVADAAGVVRTNTRTAAEIAAIEEQERKDQEKLKTEGNGKEVVTEAEVGDVAAVLGEGSADTSDKSFPKG